MARTKGTKKKQLKQVKKRSDFAIDRHPKCLSGSGLPSNYLYGDSDQPSRKVKKNVNRKRKQQIRKNAVVKKRQAVTVKLHTNMYFNYDVPWWRNNSVGKNSDDKFGSSTLRGNKPSRLLNGFTVKESSLQHFNRELAQFGEYVKLTPTEREARQSLITQVQDVCMQLFGIERSHCQVFGSFAVPSVCTFGSDIDLAIWGVVTANDDAIDGRENDLATKHQRKRSISLAETDGSVSQEEEPDSPQHPHDHPNRRKQERVLQWINAIDCCIEQDQQLQKLAVGKRDLGCDRLQRRDGDEQKSGQAENEEKDEQNDQKAEDECQLFVLDGIIVEEDAARREFEAILNEQHNWGKSKANDDISSAASSREMDREEEEADDADKLERLSEGLDRQGGQHDGHKVASLRHDGQIQEETKRVKRPRGQSMVSLSSATTCSEDDRYNDSGMEVSYIVGKTMFASQISGPTGRSRTAVVNALYKIARRLRPYASTLQVRKKAKVPIINLKSHYGFEADIAVGGHNGTDTSSYASMQVSRFKSFPAVVLVLKILLHEHGLDKPFTGGMGSYSIYVLVAHHLEQHIAQGGNDDSAEALFTFFFRYGSVRNVRTAVKPTSRTMLTQEAIVTTSDGRSTDMGSCYSMQSIVKLFELCHLALHKNLVGEMHQRQSILQSILNPAKLEITRSLSKRQASFRAERLDESSLLNDASFVNVANVRKPQSLEEDSKVVARINDDEKLIRFYGQRVDEFFPVRSVGKRLKGPGVELSSFKPEKSQEHFASRKITRCKKGSKLKGRGNPTDQRGKSSTGSYHT